MTHTLLKRLLLLGACELRRSLFAATAGHEPRGFERECKQSLASLSRRHFFPCGLRAFLLSWYFFAAEQIGTTSAAMGSCLDVATLGLAVSLRSKAGIMCTHFLKIIIRGTRVAKCCTRRQVGSRLRTNLAGDRLVLRLQAR